MVAFVSTVSVYFTHISSLPRHLLTVNHIDNNTHAVWWGKKKDLFISQGRISVSPYACVQRDGRCVHVVKIYLFFFCLCDDERQNVLLIHPFS